MTKKFIKQDKSVGSHYKSILGDLFTIIETARRSVARSVNCIMTAAYWLIGGRIVGLEQKGEMRAEYGTSLMERLSSDLTQRFGRGFSRQNLQQMRQFYLAYPPYPPDQICQTPSGELQTVSAESTYGRDMA